MQLLFIPGVLLSAGFWLNQIQKRREEKITQGQKEVEQAVATDNQRENLLHTYLDKMSELLVEKQLHKSVPEDEIRQIARVRTLTVLPRLDGPRKRSVLQFLHEADLIDKDKQIIDLHGADLRATNFSEAALFGADLGGANLFAADLGGVDLRGAYLGNVDLSGATLDGADLGDARVTTELEASAKDGISLKLPELPNVDAKYARYRSTTRLGGPLRTFGGPLRIRGYVQYDPEEYTVAYIQRSKFVLIVRLTWRVLILFLLIISTFYFPSLALYIVIAILVLLLVVGYTIVNYIDDVFVLTTKRIIDIDHKFLFFNEEHFSAKYGNIRDVTVEVGNPLFRRLDIGRVIVRTPGDYPNIEISPADHPFAIQDKIFRIKNHMEKKEERKR
jgi:uncharacterized protein YjbI with pentapeptide repeats